MRQVNYICYFDIWKRCYYSHLDMGALKSHHCEYLELINHFKVYVRTYAMLC